MVVSSEPMFSTKHSLSRFPVTFEQEYPTVATELKMLLLHSASVGLHDERFLKKLCDWADIIRKTFNDGGVDEVISTRRLVHIVKSLFDLW